MLPRRAVQQAFTMVELIVAMVILSIIAIVTSNFIAGQVQHYLDNQKRADLVSQARLVVERLGRELREALPLSVRTAQSANLQCIEFIPIVAGSNYYGAIAHLTLNQLQVLPFASGVSAGYVAINPTNLTNLYGNMGQGNLAIVQSLSSPVGQQQTINLAANTIFSSDSDRSRLYLINAPVSYCINSLTGQLTRHQNYGFNQNQALYPTVSERGQLMANNLVVTDNGAALTPFTVRPNNLLLSTVVSLDIRIREDSEVLRVNHDVYIRNIP